MNNYFRLTPNLSELITNVGVSGPFTASMIAAARCLCHPSFKIQVHLIIGLFFFCFVIFMLRPFSLPLLHYLEIIVLHLF